MTQSEHEAGRIVGLLADEARRKVVAALVLGSNTIEELCDATGLGPRDCVDALARLETGGLIVGGDGSGYFLIEQVFANAARAAAPSVEVPADADERVIATFVRDGRLVRLPTQRTKRLVILDLLAQDFEPGLKYTELEVNAIVGRWHDDYAALRRWLVDESFLSRNAGIYWRSGGNTRNLRG